jgi:hypothetical protein
LGKPRKKAGVIEKWKWQDEIGLLFKRFGQEANEEVREKLWAFVDCYFTENPVVEIPDWNPVYEVSCESGSHNAKEVTAEGPFGPSRSGFSTVQVEGQSPVPQIPFKFDFAPAQGVAGSPIDRPRVPQIPFKFDFAPAPSVAGSLIDQHPVPQIPFKFGIAPAPSVAISPAPSVAISPAPSVAGSPNLRRTKYALLREAFTVAYDLLRTTETRWRSEIVRRFHEKGYLKSSGLGPYFLYELTGPDRTKPKYPEEVQYLLEHGYQYLPVVLEAWAVR